jgi:DNA-directed RNA polymerase subunit F
MENVMKINGIIVIILLWTQNSFSAERTIFTDDFVNVVKEKADPQDIIFQKLREYTTTNTINTATAGVQKAYKLLRAFVTGEQDQSESTNKKHATVNYANLTERLTGQAETKFINEIIDTIDLDEILEFDARATTVELYSDFKTDFKETVTDIFNEYEYNLSESASITSEGTIRATVLALTNALEESLQKRIQRDKPFLLKQEQGILQHIAQYRRKDLLLKEILEANI